MDFRAVTGRADVDIPIVGSDGAPVEVLEASLQGLLQYWEANGEIYPLLQRYDSVAEYTICWPAGRPARQAAAGQG